MAHVLSAPANLRDLGGTPVGGGTVRSGVALRADDLSLCREQDAQELVARGLGAVIDLRTAAEVRNTGRGVFAGLPVGYHHLSLMTALGTGGEGARVDPRDPVAMGGLYASLYTGAADRIVTALAVVAYTPGATAFHCSAGRDRTGVVAAAFLLSLGATDEDVLTDYAVTGQNADAVRARLQPALAPVLAEHGLRGTMTRAATGTAFSVVAMETMLDTVRRRHGDPLAPLRAAGLDDGLLAALRRRAVVPAGTTSNP